MYDVTESDTCKGRGGIDDHTMPIPETHSGEPTQARSSVPLL